MKKSRTSLAVSRELYEKEYYEDSVVKAYYAVFHALQAVLLTKNLAFSKHSGVKGGFNKEFVRAGIFPKEFSVIIERLARDRNISDYSYDIEIEECEAKNDIEDAENIVASIKTYFKSLYDFG